MSIIVIKQGAGGSRGGGSGDVVGPASAIDGELAFFNGTTGKIIKGGSNLLWHPADTTFDATGKLHIDVVADGDDFADGGLELSAFPEGQNHDNFTVEGILRSWGYISSESKHRAGCEMRVYRGDGAGNIDALSVFEVFTDPAIGHSLQVIDNIHSKGIVNFDDYEDNFVARSLVTMQWVEAQLEALLDASNTTEVLFNLAGVITGNAHFTFDEATLTPTNNILTIGTNTANPGTVYVPNNTVTVAGDAEDFPNIKAAFHSRGVPATEADIYLDFRSNNLAVGPMLHFRKLANTGTSSGLPRDGELLGEVIFEGFNATGYSPMAGIRAEADGASATNDMPGRLRFMLTPSGSTTPAEAARINEDKSALLQNIWKYASDLSGSYDDRSLIDKAYADALVENLVTGPNSAVANSFVVFNGTTGKIIKEGGASQNLKIVEESITSIGHFASIEPLQSDTQNVGLLHLHSYDQLESHFVLQYHADGDWMLLNTYHNLLRIESNTAKVLQLRTAISKNHLISMDNSSPDGSVTSTYIGDWFKDTATGIWYQADAAASTNWSTLLTSSTGVEQYKIGNTGITVEDGPSTSYNLLLTHLLNGEDVVNFTEMQFINLGDSGVVLASYAGDGAGGITGVQEIEFMAGSGAGMQVRDTEDSKGFIYSANYSANWTARSIPDKGYVDTNFEPKFTRNSWSNSSTDINTLGKHRLYAYTGSTATTIVLENGHAGNNTHPWYFEIKDETGQAETNNITVETETIDIESVNDSVLDDLAHFEANIHGFKVGQIILHSGFGVGAYNGTFIIKEVDSIDVYTVQTYPDLINVDYVSDSSGDAQLKIEESTSLKITANYGLLRLYASTQGYFTR